MVDYLSTVSGGGYIVSWFAAWVWREGSLTNVEKQLSPNRISQARAERYEWDGRTRLDDRPRDEEPEPVHHLRAYSRYLSPRYGPFSPDTWTLFTIYFRNLLVNALFFLPLAMALVFAWQQLLPLYVVPIDQVVAFAGLSVSLRFLLTGLFVVAYVVACLCLAWEEENLFEANINRALRNRQAESFSVTHLGILLPLALVGLIGPCIFSLDPVENHARGYEQATARAILV